MKQPKFLIYFEVLAILMMFAFVTKINIYLMIILTAISIFMIEKYHYDSNALEINNENKDLQEQLRFTGKDSHLKSKQLVAIFASMPFPILLLDINGKIVMHHNIDVLNESKQDITNITYLNNAFYYSVKDFVHDAFILEQPLEKIINIQDVEFQAMSIPVLAKGNYSGSLVLFQNISKTLEGEKMQKRFIADASHELKTPIAVIKGMVEILNRDDFDDEQVQKEFLHQIEEEVHRLENLVKDLLQLSKLSVSNVILKRERYHIVQCIQRAINLLEHSAKAKNLTITTDFQNNEMVFIDVVKMEQVFLNLISNAIKYSEQGIITIRTYKDDVYCVCEIEDQGKGMKPQHRDYIFERFYRINDDRSRKSGGSGLGLAIVKSICEAHRIQIEVESEYQKGTMFRLKIRA